MKSIATFLLFICLIGFNFLSQAQESLNYLERSSIYDYKELNLNNTDTIPDYSSKQNKFKISGIIYESDGITPAKDVILYIEQANEYGGFELKKQNGKRYVYHSVWVKTDADGQYTIFTFLPGNDRRYNLLKQLFPIIKAPSNKEYVLDSFLFEDDTMLTKLCRKRIAKKGDVNRILVPKEKNGLLEVKKNIVLKNMNSEY